MKSPLTHDPALSPIEAIATRQKIITSHPSDFPALFDCSAFPLAAVTTRNCENMIGGVSLPVGAVGPAVFRYQAKTHECYVPLATTEGALVASVNRGIKAMRIAENAEVIVEKKGISRAPVFICPSSAAALTTKNWLDKQVPQFQAITAQTSKHLQFLSQQVWVRGRHLYVRFVFDPDEAMGMNMATIAANAISEYICAQNTGVKLVALSSNVCTDKKDSTMNQLYGRGYWVQAECSLSAATLSEVLKVNATDLIQAHVQKNYVGSNVAGSLSQNAHVANILAALYIATGQDPAHVVDGSRAALTIEANDHTGVYAALTIPSVVVGTVGGGTYLPWQTQARRIIGNGHEITAEFLAAVVGVTALAGELSLMASLAQHSLCAAHTKLGRK